MPIVFAETRALAQEWTYRFLAAAVREVGSHGAAEERFAELVAAGPVLDAPPTAAAVRAWAIEAGLPVSARGRLRPGGLGRVLLAHVATYARHTTRGRHR